MYISNTKSVSTNINGITKGFPATEKHVQEEGYGHGGKDKIKVSVADLENYSCIQNSCFHSFGFFCFFCFCCCS